MSQKQCDTMLQRFENDIRSRKKKIEINRRENEYKINSGKFIKQSQYFFF